jgi:hypothetical protein
MGTFILKPNETMVPSFPIGRLNKLENLVNAIILGLGTTPTESADGSRTSFTFPAPVKVIVVDGTNVLSEGLGFTNTGNIATLYTPPNFSIFSI